MAIPEVCGLWIEQRIQEELEGGAKSLREIGREITKEVEKLFEVRINPETVRKRAGRLGGTNVPCTTTTCNHSENSGNIGNISPDRIAEMVDVETTKTGSERKASEIVAKKTGKDPEVVRVTARRQKKAEYEKALVVCKDSIPDLNEDLLPEDRKSVV